MLDFFFFKQKTAYEMRISDWSSDVCSSDLHSAEEKQVLAERVQARPAQEWEAHLQAGRVPAGRVRRLSEALADPQLETRDVLHVHAAGEGLPRPRSEERRVGKECVSPCKSRGSPYH